MLLERWGEQIMAKVEFKNIKKSFGDVEVVKSLILQLKTVGTDGFPWPIWLW